MSGGEIDFWLIVAAGVVVSLLVIGFCIGLIKLAVMWVFGISDLLTRLIEIREQLAVIVRHFEEQREDRQMIPLLDYDLDDDLQDELEE